MTAQDYIVGIMSTQAAAIVVLAVAVARTREKVTRIEEWARLMEKRINGGKDTTKE